MLQIIIRGCCSRQFLRDNQWRSLRSALAEEEEYYDGPAQCILGVDFKSVAATGTSGFVVIAPSKGKKWIRPLSYARILHPCDNTIEHCKKLKNALVHIPDEILKYVAISSKEKMKAAEEAINKKSTTFVTLQFHNGETFKIPSNSKADMLGLRQDRLQRLLEAVNASLDILRQNPIMWDDMALEWKCRTSDNATTRNACLVNLDDVPPIMQTTCPPDCTSSRNINWIFGGIDSKLGRVQARSRPSSISEPLVMMDESLTVAELSKQLHKSLPTEVLELLRLGAGKLVLAGVATLGHVVNGMEKTQRDYDIFLVGMDDEEEAESMVAEIERLNAGKIIRTRHAMNIVSMVGGDSLFIQVIMSMNKDIATLILNFDIAPSRVAISYNPTSDALEVLCTPTFIEAVRSTMFFVELDFWGIGGLNHVMKYVFKGFNSAVPGHRLTQMRRFGCGVKYTDVGISNSIAASRLEGLFAAESLVMSRRMGVVNATTTTTRSVFRDVLGNIFDSCNNKQQFLSKNALNQLMHAPLTPSEMKQISSLCMGRSDYEGYMRSINRFVYSLRSLLDRLMRTSRRIEKNPVGLLKFSRYRRHGMFYPIDPAVNEVYIPLEVIR
eukprot:gene9412-16527_t